MDPVHVTVTVVLAAVALSGLAGQIGAGLLMLRHRAEPPIRPLLIGSAAAIGTHLAVWGLTGNGWEAAACLLPFGAVAVTCAPRQWQPPPRRARVVTVDGPTGPELSTVGPAGGETQAESTAWTSTAGEFSVRSVTDTEQAPLSASEQQAWESLRRSLDEP